MNNKKIVKKYFNKYFKEQYLDENSHEFKSLVRILNKANRPVECEHEPKNPNKKYTSCKKCDTHLQMKP
jgi:hypothetical protein